MLWLALTTLIALDPATAPPAAPETAAQAPMISLSRVESLPPELLATIRPADLTLPPPCDTTGIQRIGGVRRDMRFPTDGKVRMYHLLSLQVGNCPVPVIARDDIPEANNAIGMNAFGPR
jgi:hypothetical protein